jgi:hypothetical protein
LEDGDEDRGGVRWSLCVPELTVPPHSRASSQDKDTVVLPNTLGVMATGEIIRVIEAWFTEKL